MTHHVVQPGDTVQLGIPSQAMPQSVTPADITNFLISRGWTEYGPFDDVWKHTAKGHSELSWEQAMAIEFYEFITLGGASGQAQT